MKIYMLESTCEVIHFDIRNYAYLLRQLKIMPPEQEALNIFFRLSPLPRPTREQVLSPNRKNTGLFYAETFTIYVLATSERTPYEINKTLLHETCHFWQHCRGVYNLKTVDRTLPYKERPWEIQAARFAEHYAHFPYITAKEQANVSKSFACSS